MSTPSPDSREANQLFNPYAPLRFLDGREFRICELRARHEWDWGNVFIVEMDLTETTRGDCYSVWVTVNWEARTGSDALPSERALFELARYLTRRHFATNRARPCLSRHPFPIRLEF